MIRRNGSTGYVLVTQCDHADIAARIAAQWGNGQFPIPQPQAAVVDAIECHDAGWSMQDDKPTLNRDHIPASFYELPFGSYLRIWVASVSAAAARGGAMAGLIVSWHFTTLAQLAPREGQDESVQSLVADFTAAQHARQADYCTALGLSRSLSDFPPQAQSQRDLDALYNYWVLRACDWLSLMVCGTSLPDFICRPPEPPVGTGLPSLTADWKDPHTLRVQPWPLKVPELAVSFSGARIPVGQYRRTADLVRVFAKSSRETLKFRIVGAD